ncbi:MAG: tetratricopeptide repeat protein [Actinomycetota bacterium]
MVDVTDATFATAVVERSKTVPVIVDLWAPWCGPCKTLGPMLEAAVAATGGRVELAKVNVDENPAVAQAFQVQSIPAVFAFVDGKGVDGFIGGKPEAEIIHFVAKLVPQVDEIALLVEAGDETSLRKAVEIDPTRIDAVLALAELLIESDRPEDGSELLLPLLPNEAAEDLLLRAADALDTLGGRFVEVEEEFSILLLNVKTDEVARTRCVQLLDSLPPTDPRTVALRKTLTSRLF